MTAVALLEVFARGGRGGGWGWVSEPPGPVIGLAVVVPVVLAALYVAYGDRLRRRRKGPPRYRGHGKWE